MHCQEKSESVLSDCNEALRLNNRYVKALERRARVQRKVATASSSSKLSKEVEKDMSNTSIEEPEVTQEMVDKLRMALEDMTAVCILEGFQKQEHLMLVDSLLKELGKTKYSISIDRVWYFIYFINTRHNIKYVNKFH